MDIYNKKGRLLSNFEEWEKGFLEVDQKKHWREGYSAYSLGKFFTSGKGEQWLREIENIALGFNIDYSKGIIEYGSKLDGFRGGQRMQDLAIWGKTSCGNTCFVGIEAKVLETFGDYSVYDSYLEAIDEKENKNPRSKKAERICNVIDFFFNKRNPMDSDVRDLRYQLLHYFQASIIEAPSFEESSRPINKRSQVDIVILPVVVFNTQHYRENIKQAKSNYNDYINLITALQFNVMKVNGKEIYHKVIKNRDVYTLCEVVDL